MTLCPHHFLSTAIKLGEMLGEEDVQTCNPLLVDWHDEDGDLLVRLTPRGLWVADGPLMATNVGYTILGYAHYHGIPVLDDPDPDAD